MKLLLVVAKKIKYFVAALVILIALLVSISHLLTPIIDQHKPDLEKWTSQLLEMPVKIRQIEVGWYVYQPVIRLNDVTILDKDTKEPALKIQKVRVYLSIPQSIWQRTPVVSAIGLADTSITINESENGEFSLQELPQLTSLKQNSAHKETKISDALQWLNLQPHLYLQNIDIHYSKANKQEKFVTICDLTIQNSIARHVVVGKAILHQELPTEMSIALQWEGSITDINKMHAKMYLYASGLSLPQWLGESTYRGLKIKDGVASAKIWATWHFGEFRKIQTQFQLYELDLFSENNQSSQKIDRLSGHIGWQRDGKNQILAGNDIFIDLPNHLWPATSFYMTLTPNEKGDLIPKLINFGYIDLKDAQTFLQSFSPSLPPDVQEKLAKLKLSGNLQNLSIIFSNTWNDWRHTVWNTNFNQISFSPVGKIPGIKNLSGSVKWLGEEGDVNLASHEMVFHDDALFNHPLVIKQLTSNIHLQVDKKNNWNANILSAQLLNKSLALNVNGKMVVPETGSIELDLKANATVKHANKIANYLPMRIFEPGLVKWLEEAFIAGQVTSANAVVRGSLKDFPFNKNNGVFFISALVKNVGLKYAANWPVITDINGEVIFSGNQIKITVNDAKLLDIPLNHIRAEIPDLSADKVKLTVDGNDIASNFVQGLNFVRHSPLNETIGKMFADMEMTGPIKLKLGLVVPLNDPENTSIQGDISFKDAELNLILWNLKAKALQGNLHFTENITESNNIQGQLFNKPFKLTLETISKTKDLSMVKANIVNKIDFSDLESWLKIPFSKFVQGSAEVNTELDLSYKMPLEVHLHSNLVGTSINVLDQLKKTSEEAKNFSLDIFVEKQQPLKMKLFYDNEFSVALMLNHNKEEFNLLGTNLHLGKGDVSWPPADGFYLTGVLEKLDWDTVKNYMNGSSSHSQMKSFSLSGIDLLIKELNIGSQTFNAVNLKVTPSADLWAISINSQAVRGEIKVPKQFNSQGLVSAHFDKLMLKSSENSSNSLPNFDIKNIPAISFSADEVHYDKKALGKVSFKTVPSENGLIIKTLNIASPLMVLESSGDWVQQNNQNLTHLRGTIKSVRVSDLINSFGFNAHNLVAKEGQSRFNLTWASAPFAPSLADLQGVASFKIEMGRIVDVGEATEAKMDLGRMLSIFSLQTIPRRLSLDFSDLFQKGYSFDSVNADFMFENGSAYTSNLLIQGPVANVQLNGRIGLKNQDYDFTLSVTPHNLTAGLPIIAAMVGGPVGGVAALAFNTVLGSTVSKVATHYYSVKGPWDNPTWTTVSAR